MKHSEETKKKISETKKGKRCSPATEFKKDKHHSPSTEFKKGMTPWNKGKTLSIEIRKKLSEAHKNQKPSEEHKKKLSKLYKGRTFSEETKRKIGLANSIALKGKKMPEEVKKKISEALQGEKAPSWLGGKSFEPYAPEFNKKLKQQIRKRDSYMCQECNFTQERLGYRLPIHHIDYDKKNNSPDNLISLCKSCHAQTNFNRSDWQNYFKQKLLCHA